MYQMYQLMYLSHVTLMIDVWMSWTEINFSKIKKTKKIMSATEEILAFVGGWVVLLGTCLTNLIRGPAYIFKTLVLTWYFKQLLFPLTAASSWCWCCQWQQSAIGIFKNLRGSFSDSFLIYFLEHLREPWPSWDPWAPLLATALQNLAPDSTGNYLLYLMCVFVPSTSPLR